VGSRNYVLDGVEIPLRVGIILGPAPPIEKHWESLLRVRSKMDHSIINNGMTAGLLQPTVPLKNPPPVMRLYVKVL